MKTYLYLALLLLTTVLTGQELPQKEEKNLWNNFTYDIGNIFGGVGHA